MLVVKCNATVFKFGHFCNKSHKIENKCIYAIIWLPYNCHNMSCLYFQEKTCHLATPNLGSPFKSCFSGCPNSPVWSEEQPVAPKWLETDYCQNAFLQGEQKQFDELGKLVCSCKTFKRYLLLSASECPNCLVRRALFWKTVNEIS